ncbi:MFS general substrate transporter [Hysterangium stoloniferum]|nr:MFS general substrate transporter [Hysterangium stoloniferum]
MSSSHLLQCNSRLQPIEGVKPKKDLRFWLVLLSLCLTLFLSAIELTAVSTALATIVSDLQGSAFVWVGSAYALASSAILPMTGGIAQIFGRKPAVLASIGFFAVGSAICGAATSMDMLIAGRIIQGVGGGGILSFSAIVLADLVSLEERGLYGGIFGLTWSVAASMGPVVGGSLANAGQWRWLFYLNLPLCGFSAALAVTYINLPTPLGTLQEKLARMDWVGNFIIITSASSATFALTQGGVDAPWSSARILAPLIVGVVGMMVFMAYEALCAKNPLVPFYILANRTSFSGYVQTFLLPVTTLAAIYYVPVYFQACKSASAVHAGVLMLGLASIAPAAVIGGTSVKIFQRYRPQIWVGWALQIIGLGLLTLVNLETTVGTAVGFCVIYGCGAGINYATQVYPVQAPLPISANAHALSFHAFMRAFAGVWGVTLGGAILQNELHHRLPEAFLSEFPQGVAIVYSVIPRIGDLPQPLKDQVKQAFIDSLKKIWIALAVISAFGLFISLFMRGLPLHKVTDESWAPMEKDEGSEVNNKGIDPKVESSDEPLP